MDGEEVGLLAEEMDGEEEGKEEADDGSLVG